MTGKKPGPAYVPFKTLLEPYFDALYYTALDMTRHPADAEDMTQEAVLKAMKAFDTFRPGTDFRAWMFRILSNTVIDHFRRRNRGFALQGDPSRPAPEPTDNVEAALRALDPEQRLAVLLVDLHDFSIKEASEMMACPMGTVGSRLSRGRDTLRRVLKR